MKLFLRIFLSCFITLYCGLIYADYKADIGYTRLATELGINLPDGAGILTTQAEAATSYVDHDNNPVTPDWPVYLPDPNASAFTGKTISDMTGAELGTYSGHATGVGGLLYGSNSIASGINAIHAYWADDWFQSGFLNYGAGQPLASASRIGNHSWVGNIGDPDLAIASNLLRRMDWVIETDEFLQFVGTRNSKGTNYNLFSAAYNVLAVGKTDGNHSTGSPFVDTDYPSGRIRTEIVAPKSTTSSATPIVAATAALLVETGHSNPSLSTDPVQTSTSNRSGNTIFNAERSEVIKAALLAGADRFTRNQTPNTSTAGVITNISDYRSTGNQTINGLDARFGAGQVNTYNSYHIIAAGEQNSSQDGGTGSTGISTFGFDYDPSFGGANGSNNIASYYFSTGTDPKILTASLVWHIDIDGGRRTNNFPGTATFHDLDLYLYDVTAGQQLILNSASIIDNSENIWASLNPNRNYLLQVIPKNNFEWDYALAWQLTSDMDGDVIADHQDNCPVNPNADQLDSDGDGMGDACDTDVDGDGVSNTVDNCPNIANTDQANRDNDTYGDVCDSDIDGDGLLNTEEDINSNGIVDTGETDPFNPDTDNDGYTDGDEVTQGTDPLNASSFPVVANGDLNNDGSVNILDILLAQQILAGLVTATPEQIARGDVAPLVGGLPSPNGQFNVGDLVVIQRKTLKLINF